ncbi:MAG TPA: hypothetical protein VND65_18785 [Candidatus Binatia bacterium]|nr:hypothetical protein [Candidatus Binatia bacterium]
MTAAPKFDLSPPPFLKTLAQRLLIAGGALAVISALLAFSRPDEFFPAYLLGFMDWLGVALGSMAIIMIRHMTGGGWGVVIRRLQGAAMRTLPVLTVLFIPIVIAVAQGRMYPWAMPLGSISDDHIREHLTKQPFIKEQYLNFHGFLIRAIIYFAIWNVLSFLLTKWSREGDSPNAPDNTQRFKAVSGPGLILYAFTISFAVIDWVMSLDPTWISTIFGLIILIGEVLSAMCFAVFVERILADHKPMSEMLTPDFVHDHGKWMLAFTMVWAYFSFSQWLIIWAGNLPNEITFYLRRINGGWGGVALCLAFLGFAAPFALLLSRPFKRDIRKLVWLAIWILCIRWLDLFWIIEPNFSKTFRITISDIVVSLAIGCVWMGFFFRNLASLPLLPAYDASAGEVLEPAHH